MRHSAVNKIQMSILFASKAGLKQACLDTFLYKQAKEESQTFAN